MDRRGFLTIGATGTLVVLAGCGSDSPGNGGDGSKRTGETGSDRTGEREGDQPTSVRFADYGGNETDAGLLVWFALRNDGGEREEVTVIVDVRAGSERLTRSVSVTVEPGGTSRREVPFEVDPAGFDRWSLELRLG